VVAGLAAAAVLFGAGYATAGASVPPTGCHAVTTSSVSPPAEFPSLSAGSSNTHEWTGTATAVAPNGTLHVAWPAADDIHVPPPASAGKRSGAATVGKDPKSADGHRRAGRGSGRAG